MILEVIDSNGDGQGNILDGPFAIASDNTGNAYVTGATSNNVFRITQDGVIVEIISNQGDGVNPLKSPIGITTDSACNVFVTGWFSNNAFRIDMLGEEILDLNEWRMLKPCMTGPGVEPQPHCACTIDLNNDGVHDLRDVQLFQNKFTG